MADGITLAQANESLAIWMEADKRVAQGQAYSIGGRSLTRANAKEITDKIKFWQNQVSSLSGGGGLSIKQVLPRDL